MTATGIERKLTAIVSADVVGWARLMGADEAGTLAVLKTHRQELIDPTIAAHHGRVVGTAGDSLLIEFPSVVGAIEWAVAVQEGLRARNAERPPERRMLFRVGINLGEVIVDGGDIFGDGVNIAARLQALAEPGGICISESVHEQARGRIAVGFEDAGDHAVKNIARPIRVWRWSSAPAEPSSGSAAAAEAALGRPSIAVLPFDNMSGDPEQEYFSDGITEDIITELSRHSGLFVIARNTTFTYKGKAVDVKRVARELGVRYVLEGSVRKAGNRVRITAQLIDAENAAHVWAQRYDRDLTDIFEVQDDVTQAIVGTLPGRVEAADLERTKRKPPATMAAYDYLLRGKDHHHRVTKEDNVEACRMLEQAIALDPDYAQAHAWLACTLGQSLVFGFVPWSDDRMKRCIDAAEKAAALDNNDSEAHRVLSDIHLFRRQHDRAEFHHERAIAINPNDPRIVSQRGELLTWLGQPEDGARWIEKAMRLDPLNADRRAGYLGRALFGAGRYAEALKAFARTSLDQHANHAYLAACHAEIGSAEAARTHAAEVLRLKPDFSVDGHVRSMPYKNEADRARHRESLIKAGLPA